ncbi:MAG: hypothetical protein LBQ33_02500 [Oscillospiraceae bacterium]|nr:hypothetical protein [Oscillospiraceae bacterium]
MLFSLFLAVWVWIVVVMVNGEEAQRMITKVPVRVDFTDTISERLGLQPFWPGQGGASAELTVDVTIRGKKYEISASTVSAEDLEAVLVTSEVNTVGEHVLEIRVSPRRSSLSGNFEIVSVSQDSVRVFFDHLKTAEFELEPSAAGKITVPEGYYADVPMLSQKSVTISGPSTEVNNIKHVKAQFTVDAQLTKTTTVYDATVLPVNEYGDNLFLYLSFEESVSELKATIPVWKRSKLTPGVSFQNAPSAYLSKPLRVSVQPGSVNAALPEGSIPQDGVYNVGMIDFHQLSLSNNTFRFSAEELKEIRFFDNVTSFTAQVDLTGMEEKTLTLPASVIAASFAPGAPKLGAAFGDVSNVRVIGPAQVVRALDAAALSGEVLFSEETQPGSTRQPVSIRVKNREDCWIVGEYTAACILTEE